MFRRLGFRATINTDNRLMSGVSLSSEMARCAEVFGWDWADLRWLSINAMKSAFCDFDERLALINGVIKPGYDALAAAGRLPGFRPRAAAACRRGLELVRL